jgi:hypothetical protein
MAVASKSSSGLNFSIPRYLHSLDVFSCTGASPCEDSAARFSQEKTRDLVSVLASLSATPPVRRGFFIDRLAGAPSSAFHYPAFIETIKCGINAINDRVRRIDNISFCLAFLGGVK